MLVGNSADRFDGSRKLASAGTDTEEADYEINFQVILSADTY
jgi:hypothetical protein